MSFAQPRKGGAAPSPITVRVTQRPSGAQRVSERSIAGKPGAAGKTRASKGPSSTDLRGACHHKQAAPVVVRCETCKTTVAAGCLQCLAQAHAGHTVVLPKAPAGQQQQHVAVAKAVPAAPALVVEEYESVEDKGPSEYAMRESGLCAGLSEAAYEKPEEIEAHLPKGTRLVDHFSQEGREAAVVAFIAVDDTRKTVYLVFRGTWSFEDLKIDFMFTTTTKPITARAPHITAHTGMFDAEQTDDAKLLQALKTAIDARPQYRVVVTGHSLGGAYALLFYLVHHPKLADTEASAVSVDAVYTYGAPMVVACRDAAAAAQFPFAGAEQQTSVYSWVNREDPVPRLFNMPLLAELSYRPLGTVLWIRGDARYDVVAHSTLRAQQPSVVSFLTQHPVVHYRAFLASNSTGTGTEMDADGPLPAPTAEEAERLKDEVTRQLSRYNVGAELSTLVEYTMIMLSNSKSRGEVAEQLLTFLPEDTTDKFTRWLWQRVQDCARDTQRSIDSEIGLVSTGRREGAPEAAGGTRIFRTALKASVRRVVDAQPPSPPEADADMAPAYPRHKRQRSDARQQPTFTMTFNADAIPPLIPERGVAAAAAAEGDEAEHAAGPAGSEPAHKSPRRTRCRFWPECRNEQCPYHHPRAPCRDWPDCPRGAACLFVHDELQQQQQQRQGGPDPQRRPCRFGARCTNPDCKFSHDPADAAAAAAPGSPAAAHKRPLPLSRPRGAFGAFGQYAAMAPMMMPMGMPMMQARPCRLGYSCPGRADHSCSFDHPPPACRYGSACRNRTTGCPFAHGRPCNYGVECATPGCTFVHGGPLKDCKFGNECTNPQCPYNHPVKDDAIQEAAIATGEHQHEMEQVPQQQQHEEQQEQAAQQPQGEQQA
eukprot:m51a1_g5022 hypothetical protein (878) ;mRNA; f:332383-336102